MKSLEDRTEDINRLYEDVRRSLNGRDFTKAARLSLQLYAELADAETVRQMAYPVCLECNGYAEVVDPKHPELKVACRTAPSVCPGNQNGRMSPAAFTSYLDAKLEPTRQVVTESMQHPTVPGGDVPRLPHDGMQATPPPSQDELDNQRAARIARQNTNSGNVEEAERGQERPEVIQS